MEKHSGPAPAITKAAPSARIPKGAEKARELEQMMRANEELEKFHLARAGR